MHEILITGGGPAAVALARQLSGLGFTVAVATRPRTFQAIEGFSPRTLDLVSRFCGVPLPEDTIPRTVHWDGEASAPNRESLIDRDRFDRGLIARVRDAGVDVIEGRVTAAVRTSSGWLVNCRLPDGDEVEMEASFLVEARGRSAPLGGGKHVRGPALVCLSRRWRFPESPSGQAGVAAFEDGWAWFIRQSDGHGVLQLFVDPKDGLPRRDRLADFYQSTVNRITEARDWLAGGAPSGSVHARYAGMALSGGLCSGASLRVGDAALAIDPLSGHGVYKAISGALAAAPVINTLIRRPEHAALAQAFYRDRLTDDFWASARIARDFYAQETRWADRPFWAARRDWPDDAPAHLPIVAGEGVAARRPVVRDNYVEEQEVLVTPDQPRGVWQVAGIPAVELWRDLMDARRGAEQLSHDYGVSADAAQAALGWFQEHGLVGNG